VLQGCEPVDILMAKRDGRFSGEAFVVLSSPLQIQMAEDKNKSYMGRRYVEVFRAKKQVSRHLAAPNTCCSNTAAGMQQTPGSSMPCPLCRHCSGPLHPPWAVH
jgi:hypothetical protein